MGAPKTPFEVRRRTNQCLGFRMVQVKKLISDSLEETGSRPSYREICDALGIDGKGNVSRIVKALRDRGELPGEAA